MDLIFLSLNFAPGGFFRAAGGFLLQAWGPTAASSLLKASSACALCAYAEICSPDGVTSLVLDSAVHCGGAIGDN